MNKHFAINHRSEAGYRRDEVSKHFAINHRSEGGLWGGGGGGGGGGGLRRRKSEGLTARSDPEDRGGHGPPVGRLSVASRPQKP